MYAGAQFEQVIDTTNDFIETKFRLTDYLTITLNNANIQNRHFLQRDRLGSVTQILDENGALVSTKGYDAFGKPRNGDDWSAMTNPVLAFDDENSNLTADVTKRGFTDHEHLDAFELIHMNGRMYDFNNGRFLSVDPFIQGTTSQAINPYSYIQNNPLSGTDPTGYYRIPDNCNAVDENCSAANVTIKDMVDAETGETDNGHANRFTMQAAGAGKIGNSLTLADLESQAGTVTLLPIDFGYGTKEEQQLRKILYDGESPNPIGEAINLPWGEYLEQDIRAKLYREQIAGISGKQFSDTIGLANTALKLSIDLDQFNGSASANNIQGLGLFNIDGEYMVSETNQGHALFGN